MSESPGMMEQVSQSYYWKYLPEAVEVVIGSPCLEELDYSRISSVPEDPSSNLYVLFWDPRSGYQE
jgi:hypothetical protein